MTDKATETKDAFSALRRQAVGVSPELLRTLDFSLSEVEMARPVR